MHTSANHIKLREVINQVVNDPHYKKVATIPLISVPQIALITLSYACVIGGIALNLYYYVSLWLVYPMIIFGVYTAFTPLHDATHNALSSNGFLNDVLGTISGTLILPGVNTAGYRYLHLAHHRYVGDKDLDPDELLVGVPTHYFPFGYLFLLFTDYSWGYWFYFKAWNRTPTRMKWNITLVFALNVAFNVFWLMSPFWYEYLVLFLIPNRLGQAYTAYAFAHIQHGDGQIWENHPFQSTFKIEGNFYYLQTFWGQDNHHMHHFLPHIPWFKYKDVMELANGVFKKQGIPLKGVFDKPQKNFAEQVAEYNAKIASTIEVRVTAIEQITAEIKRFTFEAKTGGILPEFTAGAHICITLPSGKQRNYSLVNPPFERNQYQIAVKLEAEGKGGSKEMHEQIKAGDILTISRPKNNFVLYESVQKYILIAGGIGITPLISMAHRLTELEKYFEFHVCAKSMDNVPFQYELKNWSFAPNVEIHLDKNNRSSIDLASILAAPNENTLVYICGPLGFNKWIKSTAIEKGWQPEQIKQEIFSLNSSEITTTKPFEVVLQKSGQSMMVDKNSTIIDALLMNNKKVPYTCLQGTCGTCITSVLEGEIEHRDSVLSEEEKLEGQKMCICVSRAKGDRVVLDI